MATLPEPTILVGDYALVVAHGDSIGLVGVWPTPEAAADAALAARSYSTDEYPSRHILTFTGNRPGAAWYYDARIPGWVAYTPNTAP